MLLLDLLYVYNADLLPNSQHIDIHLRPYLCRACGRGFSALFTVRQHENALHPWLPAELEHKGCDPLRDGFYEAVEKWFSLLPDCFEKDGQRLRDALRQCSVMDGINELRLADGVVKLIAKMSHTYANFPGSDSCTIIHAVSAKEKSEQGAAGLLLTSYYAAVKSWRLLLSGRYETAGRRLRIELERCLDLASTSNMDNLRHSNEWLRLMAQITDIHRNISN